MVKFDTSKLPPWLQVKRNRDIAIAVSLATLATGAMYGFEAATKKKPEPAQVQANQQNATQLPSQEVERGAKVFRELNGIYRAAGQFTPTPAVWVVVPESKWNKLSKSDQISLTFYAQSLISVVRAEPARYTDIDPTAPAYNTVVTKNASLCQDCWSIIVSERDSQPYGIDKVVVQGDTPWQTDDPCCRGIQGSEFRK